MALHIPRQYWKEPLFVEGGTLRVRSSNISFQLGLIASPNESFEPKWRGLLTLSQIAPCSGKVENRANMGPDYSLWVGSLLLVFGMRQIMFPIAKLGIMTPY